MAPRLIRGGMAAVSTALGPFTVATGTTHGVAHAQSVEHSPNPVAYRPWWPQNAAPTSGVLMDSSGRCIFQISATPVLEDDEAGEILAKLYA